MSTNVLAPIIGNRKFSASSDLYISSRSFRISRGNLNRRLGKSLDIAGGK